MVSADYYEFRIFLSFNRQPSGRLVDLCAFDFNGENYRVVCQAMKKINILLGLLIGLGLFLIRQWPDKDLHLIFCDVGQGDAILITSEFQQILVDGGPDNSVLSCLGKNMPFWDRKIDLVLLTHNQTDHALGLMEVEKRYQIINNQPKLLAGDEVVIGQLKLTVLWPYQRQSNELNEEALVLQGSFGKFNWLLSADITGKEEEKLRLLNRLKPVEVLKAAHHGSKYSSSQKFLEAVRPKIAVISVGKNSFGHPTQEALDRLKSVGAKILRTDEAGMIEVVSDGQNWGLNPAP